MDDIIIYEQPLNEVIRVCLRLEQLFQQLDHQHGDLSPISLRLWVSLIINILNLLDRPDLKAKLAKELSHHLSAVLRLEDTPGVDKKEWKKFVEK